MGGRGKRERNIIELRGNKGGECVVVGLKI